MVIFSPKNPIYTVTVFTDVDCQYCRKLHSEIAEIKQARHPGALSVFPAYGAEYGKLAQGGSGLVLGGSQRGVHPRQGGGRARHEQEPAARRRWRGSTRSVRASGCAARPAIVTDGGDFIKRVHAAPGTLEDAQAAAGGGARERRGRRAHGASGALALQELQLVLDALPLLGVGGRFLHLADHRPFLASSAFS